MSAIFDLELESILEGTSRSFYLSLKELPKPIRPQISLLYLLARISDTIADSKEGPIEIRLEALESFNRFSQGSSETSPDLSRIAIVQPNQSERRLLECVEKVTSRISDFSQSDQEKIRRCLGIIISGQILDLKRSPLTKGAIQSIGEERDLDDYAYRVAGSVGEFWTLMSLEHLFNVDSETEEGLLEKGVRFGKALQMINILRDVPSDLSIGRCYIPEKALSEFGLIPEDLMEPEKMEQFRPLYNKYLDITDSHLRAAVDYISLIPHSQFRLRGSCMIPVVIGKRTVSMLREGNVLDPINRIKIDRKEVKDVIKSVLMAIPFRGSSRKLLGS